MPDIELDLNNKSFYDFPTIKPTDTCNDGTNGPIKDIPGRTHTTPSDMTTMGQVIHGNTKEKPAPENDPHFWNQGGNGAWWSVFPDTQTK